MPRESPPEREPLDLLTPEQVGRMIGVAPKTLAQWRSQGRGPEGFRMEGGLIRYRRSKVERWVQEQERKDHINDRR